jgi:hypothetical protein
MFLTPYLGENVINLLQQKVAQKVTISLGYFIFSKNHNEPPKVAQLVKNHLIWSPCPPPPIACTILKHMIVTSGKAGVAFKGQTLAN